MSHVLTISYTEGCGGAPLAANVANAVAAEREDLRVDMVLVRGEADAAALGFRGSPTVLVDAEDIEPDPKTPLGSMG